MQDVSALVSDRRKLICVAGARPNFMKLAPLMRELQAEERIEPVLVHTGQHYDERMSGQFFRDLKLKDPDFNLEVGSGSHAAQTAEIMKRFEPVMEKTSPAAVLVVGDVNSTMACSVVAKKMNVPVVHVESGLRSFDRAMPEEINRLITDAISDLLLVSEESGLHNLRQEGVPEKKMRLVGNLMIDSLYFHLENAKGSDVLMRCGVQPGGYGVVTLHRPSNVDDPRTLQEIVSALGEISRDLPLLFPVHPRTRTRLNAEEFAGRLTFLDPLGYLDFVSLMSNAAAVFTDSGGIQEETTALRIPCFTLRNNTERPVTVEQGSNVLAGTERESILSAWREQRRMPRGSRVPQFWDGHTAKRCREALVEFLA